MNQQTEEQMVTEAIKIAKLRAETTGRKENDYDTLQALIAMCPETKDWTGHKLMNIIRTIRG